MGWWIKLFQSETINLFYDDNPEKIWLLRAKGNACVVPLRRDGRVGRRRESL